MFELSCDAARLLYTWLIAWLDINGVFVGNPKKIWSKVFYLSDKPEHSPESVKKYLDEMVALNLIIRYEVNGNEYIWYPDFHEKQVFSQNYYENSRYPINETIRAHNENIRASKARKRAHTQPAKEQTKTSADLPEVHSFWEAIHKKKTGEYIQLTEAQKTKLCALLEKYDGKVKKCIARLYDDFREEYWTPDKFFEGFEIILQGVR